MLLNCKLLFMGTYRSGRDETVGGLLVTYFALLLYKVKLWIEAVPVAEFLLFNLYTLKPVVI